MAKDLELFYMKVKAAYKKFQLHKKRDKKWATKSGIESCTRFQIFLDSDRETLS